MAWSEERAATPAEPPMELPEILQTYSAKEPQDTPNLTIAQGLAFAVMNKLEQDTARIRKRSYFLGTINEGEEGQKEGEPDA